MSGAGYMAFIEEDGSLRPHHDIFNQFVYDLIYCNTGSVGSNPATRR